MVEIALAFIFKDEEQLLPQFLSHHEKLFDEIIAVDTGSSDQSVEIVKSFGIKPLYFPWQDDFSAARNFSLNQVTKPYVMVLDVDERIETEDFNKLKKIIRQTEKKAYWLQLINLSNDYTSLNWQSLSGELSRFQKIASGYEKFPLIRVFQNLKEIRFRGLIHEYISIDNYRLETIPLDIPIIHFGWLYSNKEQKMEKYNQLIKKNWEIEKTPQSALYYLKTIKEPASRLHLSWQMTKIFPDYYQFYEIMAESALDLKQHERALDYLRKAQKLCPGNSQLLALEISLLLESGRYREAHQKIQEIPENVEHPFFDLQRIKLAIFAKNFAQAEKSLEKLKTKLPPEDWQKLYQVIKEAASSPHQSFSK